MSAQMSFEQGTPNPAGSHSFGFMNPAVSGAYSDRAPGIGTTILGTCVRDRRSWFDDAEDDFGGDQPAAWEGVDLEKLERSTNRVVFILDHSLYNLVRTTKPVKLADQRADRLRTKPQSVEVRDLEENQYILKSGLSVVAQGH